MLEIPPSRGFGRDQLSLIRVYLHNLLYNILPFFTIKNWYLWLAGNQIGNKSYIHTPLRCTYFGNLKVGDHSTVNFGCLLDTRAGIEIGNNVMIGHFCKIYTVGHDIDDAYFGGKPGKVTIEDDVVIFPNSLIMPGVTIQRGAVVYPGSVVTKNLEPFDVVGGNPARFIRKRANKISYRLNYKNWFINS